MALDGIIPRRPQGIESKLSAADKNCIEYLVAFGVKNEEAFLLFHPEYMTADGKLNQSGKRACRDFFGYSKNKEYREAYTAFLKEFVKGAKSASINESVEEITEERKSDAVKAYLLNVIKVLKDGDIKDPDTIKILTDIVNKVGWLKSDAEQIMKPIRVLPTRCKSECRYRAFVETYKTKGIIFDDCDYCKARAFAEEHGFKYDPCTVLDVPQSVIDEIDSKNDVRLEDIISGKVQN